MFTLLDDGSKATSNMPSRLDPALQAGSFFGVAEVFPMTGPAAGKLHS
jgi:hypothetical protein